MKIGNHDQAAYQRAFTSPQRSVFVEHAQHHSEDRPDEGTTFTGRLIRAEFTQTGASHTLCFKNLNGKVQYAIDDR